MTDRFYRTRTVVSSTVDVLQVPRTVVKRIAAERIRIVFFCIGETGVGFRSTGPFLTSASDVRLIAGQLGLEPHVVARWRLCR